MAATTWHPRTHFEKPRQWLLENGEVVTEPPLEETSTGRKVRVAGTNMSAYSGDMHNLILRAVDAVAQQKQTSVWMPLHDSEAALQRAVGFVPDEVRADLFLLKPGTKTIVWWRFKHPTLPITALLYVTAGHVNMHYPQNGQAIAGALAMPRSQGGDLVARYRTTQTPWFTPIVEDVAKREFIRDNPSNWDSASILGQQQVNGERQLVKVLLERVRACDELETIQIPDMRDGELGWLDLELYETNLNSGFLSDLTDYLEGDSTIDEALRIYGELRECLRGIGMYLNELSENDFNRGLLGGEDSYVTAQVMSGISATLDEGAVDQEHTLKMHLPSGTFVVDCNHKVNHGEAADKWEEARTIASLSGVEDELLAYARRHASTQHDRRSKTILAERKQHQ